MKLHKQEAKITLVHQSREKYKGDFESHLLEQYKLYVQSADNVSARRLASTRFCLTLNTALVALYGFQNEPLISLLGVNIWPIVISTIGVIVAIVWYLIIKFHSNLNSVKFQLIHELESHLPAALYDYEWVLLAKGKGKIYIPVSKIEQWIPIVFLIIHTILIVVTIMFLVAQQSN